MLTAILACVGAAIWTYLFFFRGGFWLIRDESEHVPSLSLTSRPNVVAVVPARDEADVIARAVRSLLAQEYPIHVVLCDDHSTDGTSEVAIKTAHQMGASDRLHIVRARPLPAGWKGKLWAVSEGIRYAIDLSPEFYLLTDADIEHAPDNVRNLVARAEEEKRDLVSLMVRLRCESLAERCLIPAFVYFFFKLYPPRWVANQRAKTAAAAGGCMMVRRSALEAAGGIESIRTALIDDCALGRTIKQNGSIWLGATSRTESIREYTTFHSIWKMISRSAFDQLHHSVFELIGACLGMLLTYVVPVVLVFLATGWPRIVAAATLAIIFISFLPILLLYRRSPLWAVLLPLTAVFYTAATVDSALRYWSGRGGEWKGRVQDARSGA